MPRFMSVFIACKVKELHRHASGLRSELMLIAKIRLLRWPSWHIFGVGRDDIVVRLVAAGNVRRVPGCPRPQPSVRWCCRLGLAPSAQLTLSSSHHKQWAHLVLKQ